MNHSRCCACRKTCLRLSPESRGFEGPQFRIQVLSLLGAGLRFDVQSCSSHKPFRRRSRKNTLAPACERLAENSCFSLFLWGDRRDSWTAQSVMSVRPLDRFLVFWIIDVCRESFHSAYAVCAACSSALVCSSSLAVRVFLPVLSKELGAAWVNLLSLLRQ